MTTTRRHLMLLTGGGALAAIAPAGCNRPAEAAGGVGEVDETDRQLGDPNAPVTLIEYASPTCGHCANFHLNVYPKLKEGYIDTGRVQFVMREAVLQSADYYIWLTARCLPADDYFTFVSLAFDYQRSIIEALYKDTETFHEELGRISRSVGLNTDQYQGCIENQQEIDRLQAINQAFIDAYGGMSTPSFLINGERQETLPEAAEPANQLTIADFDAVLQPLLGES